MSKTKEIYACSACGAVHTKWLGKCPDCGAWDSLEAERIETKVKLDPRASAVGSWASHQPETVSDPARNPARSIKEINTAASGSTSRRIITGINELDRVAGGGFVPGSAILLGGDPGIGKSTLLLQAAGALARNGTKVLYVSSEESAEQVRMRAARLHADSLDNLYVLSESSLSRIAEQAAQVLQDASSQPPVLIIDSIQMIYKADLSAFPGSLTQLRQCTAELVFMAKATGATIIMVGHVTKDGMLSGPRMLEHLVDAVLYFEGDRYHAHRIIRAVKNRFGSTLELGLFEMTGDGLREAPAGALLSASGAGDTPRPGTVVCPVLTGTRCLLVEIQALTATGFPGATKRKASGIDPGRLAMLIAVLEQHAGLRLADRDIFASVVGGVKVAEPAADLALLTAIAGAQLKRALPPRTIILGEVGLGGEVRPVAQLDNRLIEASRLGYSTAIVPVLSKKHKQSPPKGCSIELVPVQSINQAIDHLSAIGPQQTKNV